MTKSDACAQHDGIQRIMKNHCKIYLVPCKVCGQIVERKQYMSDKDYLCAYCKLSLREKQKVDELSQKLQTKSKKEMLFDKAVDEIKAQVGDMTEYQRPIKIALTRVERYGSIPEMMVAIELLRLKYAIIPQQKIGRYRVDFLLRSVKRVIEVDGSVYHADGVDLVRDAYIKLRLGDGWEVIHIPAELIRKHIRSLGKVISDNLQHQTKK